MVNDKRRRPKPTPLHVSNQDDNRGARIEHLGDIDLDHDVSLDGHDVHLSGSRRLETK